MDKNNYNWDAYSFFKGLRDTNRLCEKEQFKFCRVSGLEGFEEALENMQSSTAFICVSDTAQGYTDIYNTPRTRRVKTIFLAKRHALGDMGARQKAFDTLREVFRQFMTRLIREKVKIEQQRIYLDPRITFHEIDQYFFSGCACAYFTVAVDIFTDLTLNVEDWTTLPSTDLN